MSGYLVQLVSDVGFGGDVVLVPCAYAPMDVLAAAGDVVTAPVPWRAKWRVRDVAQGEGYDWFPWVPFDPDEYGYVWFDVELLVESCTDTDTVGVRHLTLGRFPQSSPEARGHALTFG